MCFAIKNFQKWCLRSSAQRPVALGFEIFGKVIENGYYSDSEHFENFVWSQFNQLLAFENHIFENDVFFSKQNVARFLMELE